ncbi:MAG TPA: MFS transporter [Candidatus Acidoferrum sp.]|jgi:fucose permease|nr:MFS transporter [Candidatus Acidoferrum sp.]
MSEQTAAPAKDKGHRNLLIVLFAGFVLSGIATTIIGPLIPVFKQRWPLDDSQLGLFGTIQFLAALAGTLASSVIHSWWGYRPALALGYALMGCGLVGLNADTRFLVMVACAGFGLGYGLLTSGTNLFVAELGGAKSASLLNLLNFTWGLGATSCSSLIAMALARHGLPVLLVGLGIFGGLIVLGLLFTSFGEGKHDESAKANEATGTEMATWVTVALAAMFFIYVSMETSVGYWAAEYAKRLANGITGLTTLAPMFFYGGLTSGRLSAPLVLHRVSERKVVLGALSLAVTANVFLTLSPSLKPALVAVFFAGLGYSTIYPIYIAWLSRWYGPRAKKIGGILFALASLGGSAGPWLVGFVSKLFGSLRVGLLVPFAFAVSMIVLVLLLRRQTTA